MSPFRGRGTSPECCMAERQCFTGSCIPSKVIARRRDVETEERELNLNRRRVFGDGIGVLNTVMLGDLSFLAQEGWPGLSA
jgi:hypothetical protein